MKNIWVTLALFAILFFGGMVTLTPRRTQTSRKIQVPRSLIRYKLVNVDEEYQ